MEGVFCGAWCYSDDSYIIAPSLEALQEMLKLCEEFADNHNLMFSTDSDPHKCKTKCIAFLHKERELMQMKLCGNRLPWVKRGSHLGHELTDK